MDDKNLSRRARERLWHRDQMLAAALELFSEKGYHNVSMNEIAQKAEFAIGTLYKFFRNKEDLYKALIRATAEEYHRTLKEALGKSGDVLTALKNYIAAKAAVFANNFPTLRLYLAQIHPASLSIKSGLDQDIGRLYEEVVEQLTVVLEKGVRKKLFREMDPYHMALALEGMTNAFLLCWLQDPSQHAYEGNVPAITDLFLRGILMK